jgi:thioredoxin 1
MHEINLTNQNFEEEVLKSDLPVLVDFFATWCGPCKMLAPVIAEIAERYEGKVKVGKLNVDDENGLAMKYQISSIPTLVLFKEGKVVSNKIGLCSKSEIENMINSLK